MRSYLQIALVLLVACYAFRTCSQPIDPKQAEEYTPALARLVDEVFAPIHGAALATGTFSPSANVAPARGPLTPQSATAQPFGRPSDVGAGQPTAHSAPARPTQNYTGPIQAEKSSASLRREINAARQQLLAMKENRPGKSSPAFALCDKLLAATQIRQKYETQLASVTGLDYHSVSTMPPQEKIIVFARRVDQDWQAAANPLRNQCRKLLSATADYEQRSRK